MWRCMGQNSWIEGTNILFRKNTKSVFKLQFHYRRPQWMQRKAITDHVFRQNDYQTVLKFWALFPFLIFS